MNNTPMNAATPSWPAPIVAKPRRRGGRIAALAGVAALLAGGAGGTYLYVHDSAAEPAAASSDESEIRSVLGTYLTETEFSKIRPVMCRSLVDSQLADGSEAQLDAIARSNEQLAGISTVDSYETIEVSYDRARVLVVSSLSGGTRIPPLSDLRFTVGLVREDGAWKACTDPEPDAATLDLIDNGLDRTNASAALTTFFDRIAAADLVGIRNSTCGDLAKTLESVTAESVEQFAHAVGTIESIDESTVTGDAATVTATLDYGDEKTVAAYSLIRTGSTWKVCAEKILT